MSGTGQPRVSVIAALAKNRVIGIENRLPWRLPEDLAHFKALTLDHPVLMGRKTFESLGRPLPRRTNVVITRNADYRPDGCLVAASMPAAIALCQGADEIFFIGGAELYAQAIPLADRLYLTEVDAEPEGDAWFPEFDRAAFREISRASHVGEKGDVLRFDFVVYERR
ncbi:dihydrofolate reductase [Thiobacillus denitrificans ATCC 25259]|uniref:Dihydrofolate reductase n=1 Tax=Thiobacillus denitrificans (strain ATCC 25259 / T1) TaxID=292415 RepID=Q3SH97_THIDA|nr:dihydrofolate reductase [Thiobacillus denitrificans]AAZ97992.1 dihydrofolate reductase [Thiobacillus denitrificans ATCC 25259]